MKIKTIYAILLLLCCTLGASPNRHSACPGMKSAASEKPAREVVTGAAEALVTSYLPGYSIIFIN